MNPLTKQEFLQLWFDKWGYDKVSIEDIHLWFFGIPESAPWTEEASVAVSSKGSGFYESCMTGAIIHTRTEITPPSDSATNHTWQLTVYPQK